MDKAFVAKKVATKLRATEHAIDSALVEASEMVSELIRARMELTLGANVGDVALARVTASVAALSEARTAMVEAHAQLAEVQLRIGVRTKMHEDKAEDGATKPIIREVA